MELQVFQINRGIDPGLNSSRQNSWHITLMFLGAVGISVLLGLLTAMGGGIVAILLIVAVAGLFISILNFRIGIWLAVFLLPFSATQLIPREMLGVTGLNPFNLMVLVALGSLILTKTLSEKNTINFPAIPKVFWAYLCMLVAAGFYGSFSAHKVIMELTTTGDYGVLTAKKYLLLVLIKPLVIMLVAYMAGIVARNGKKTIGIYWAIVLALLTMALVVFLTIGMSGFSLTVLASSKARGFLSWIGMHSNEIGIFFTMGFSLLLYSSLADERMFRRIVLMMLAYVVAAAAAFTFSRSAFLGLLVVLTYFFISRRKIGQAIVGLIVVAVVALSLPGAFIERATTGITHGSSEDLTAGRVSGIWLPLIPEVLDSPLIGHGLGSIIWAKATLSGEVIGGAGLAHNAYLETLLDFGLLGLIIVGIFFVFVWRMFRLLKEAHPDALWRGYFEGASVCILVLLAQGMTSEKFIPTYPQGFFWVSIGLALGFRETIKSKV